MVRENATQSAMPWAPFAEAWSRASEHMTRSVLEANRAAVAAFGASIDRGGDGAGTPFEAIASPLEAMAYRQADWEFDGSTEEGEDLAVGDRVVFRKRLTDANVRAFARASGDTNRLHLDDEFAGRSRFGGRIVHGTLAAGLISAALARLPHLTIYLSQDLAFERPVEIGEELTAICEVVEDLGGRRYRLSTVVENAEGETVIDGEAVVLIDELPEGPDQDS